MCVFISVLMIIDPLYVGVCMCRRVMGGTKRDNTCTSHTQTDLHLCSLSYYCMSHIKNSMADLMQMSAAAVYLTLAVEHEERQIYVN